MIENILFRIFIVIAIVTMLAHLIDLILTDIRCKRDLRELAELKKELRRLEEGEADA